MLHRVYIVLTRNVVCVQRKLITTCKQFTDLRRVFDQVEVNPIVIT